MLVSMVVAPVLLVATDTEWIRLAGMALASTVAAVVAPFWSPATEDAVLDRFYRRVRPLGLWATTAVRTGDSPRQPISRLLREGRTTLLVACSVFLTLVGAGKLLIRLPDAATVWAWAALGVAALLVPLWWRDALGPDPG